MNAVVTRNGAHQGHQFVEVEANGVNYAVPVSQELPLGTEIEITVKVVEAPPPVEPLAAGTDVSTTTAPELVVPESPLVVEPVVEAPPVKEAPDKKGKGK